jgi:hypothetical protein
MELGEVYLWETDLPQGRGKRRKFQVFVGQAGRFSLFLFINTMEWFKDYKLLRADYSFLEYDSFVACNAVASYTADQLKNAAPALVGKVSAQHLKELRDAIIAAETMPQGQANFVCKSLAGGL